MESKLKELLPLNLNEDEEVIVSSRGLHEYLQIQTRYNVWILRMITYGFVENEDYIRSSQKCDTPGGNQEVVDYLLKIDMAKEICMLQRSEKGRVARKYFIEMEKQFNSPEALLSRLIELKNNMKNNTEQSEKQSNDTPTTAKVKASTYTISTTNIDTNFRDSAKIMGIKESLFINWLLLNNYCYRDEKENIKPYAKYMDYFTLREFSTDTGYVGVQTLINSQGREVFRSLLIDENIIKNNGNIKLLN